MYNSRLQTRYTRKSQQKIALLIGGSVILLIVLFTVGLPALFTLSGTISNFRHKNTPAAVENGIAPATPHFSQEMVATSSARAKVNGTADQKTTVEIFQNTRSLGTILVNDDGTFSQDVDLERGANIFTAVAINEAGQKSPVSQTYQINLLTGKPKLDVTSPKDGDSTRNSPISVSGQTDSGNSISVNDRLAIVDKDGKFSYSFDLSGGDNKLKIIASDIAGNQTTKELTVKYQN
jgi:hypothetical protein